MSTMASVFRNFTFSVPLLSKGLPNSIHELEVLSASLSVYPLWRHSFLLAYCFVGLVVASDTYNLVGSISTLLSFPTTICQILDGCHVDASPNINDGLCTVVTHLPHSLGITYVITCYAVLNRSLYCIRVSISYLLKYAIFVNY